MDENGLALMLALATSCWLVGMMFAQYFRIYALVPLILATCVVAGMIGVAQGHEFEQIILACIVSVVCLQFGFLVGALSPIHGKDRPRFPIKKTKVRDETAPRPNGVVSIGRTR